MPTSFELASNPNARRIGLGRAAPLVRPLSDPDRDFLEYKAGQLQAPGYISDDYARTLDLLGQDNALTRGARATAGPAMFGLQRSGASGGGGNALGTGGSGPGEIPDSIALNSLLADKSFGFQQLALEDAVQARQERASALMSPTASQRLHSGQTAADQRAAGDILRDEQLRNATATGQAEANTYFAPGQNDMRRQKVWHGEYAARAAQPFDKNVIEANARMRAAEAAQLARQYAADQQRAGNVEGRVVTGYANVAGKSGMTPEDQQRIATATNNLGERAGFAPVPEPQPVVPPSTLPWPMSTVSNWLYGAGRPVQGAPGQSAAPPQQQRQPGYPGGPVPGSRGVFPAARLQEYAAESGMTIEQARQFIEMVHGYSVE